MNTDDLKIIEDLILKTLLVDYQKNVWFSLDLLQIFSQLNIKKRNQMNIAMEKIFDLLLEIGNNFENLYVAAFTYDFPKKRYFNSLKSEPYIGSFSKYIFNQGNISRTLHPFYSFFNFGSKNNKIANEHTDHVGQKSIFNFMIQNKFKQITLGHHYVKSFSIIHHIENLLNVDFREEIIYEGIISDGFCEKKDSFNYFFRKLDICDISGLTFLGLKKIEGQGIVSLRKIFEDKNLFSYVIDLKECTEFITAEHSILNPLVDYFHQKNNINLNFVTGKNADNLYKKLLL